MKYCSKCGNANADEAIFCGSCGTPIEQAPTAPQAAPAPEPVAFNAPPPPPTYAAPAYDAAYSAPVAVPETKNTATLWLILNIVSTVLCCSGLVGIAGIIFAAIGTSSYSKGDYEDMKKKAKISMILFIASVVWGILFEIGVIIALVASNAFRGY